MKRLIRLIFAISLVSTSSAFAKAVDFMDSTPTPSEADAPTSGQKYADVISICVQRIYGAPGGVNPDIAPASIASSERVKQLLVDNCVRRGYGIKLGRLTPDEVDQLRDALRNEWSLLGDAGSDEAKKNFIRAALKDLRAEYPDQTAELQGSKGEK